MLTASGSQEKRTDHYKLTIINLSVHYLRLMEGFVMELSTPTTLQEMTANAAQLYQADPQ